MLQKHTKNTLKYIIRYQQEHKYGRNIYIIIIKNICPDRFPATLHTESNRLRQEDVYRLDQRSCGPCQACF